MGAAERGAQADGPKVGQRTRCPPPGRGLRRRILDRALGYMAGRSMWAVKGIAKLGAAAESESVQLKPRRAILHDQIAVSRFSNLEYRMAELEEQVRVRIMEYAVWLQMRVAAERKRTGDPGGCWRAGSLSSKPMPPRLPDGQSVAQNQSVAVTTAGRMINLTIESDRRRPDVFVGRMFG